MDDERYADALLAAALRYAAGGLYVFPAYVERPDPLEHAKQARFIGQWRTASSTDPATIRAWWEPGGPWRGAHICVDCGKSGIVVLDADGADAVEHVEAMGRRHVWANVVSASTPSGGRHYWFRENYRIPIGNSASQLAPGVDVRGMGGLVYAAPSRDSAGSYGWLGPEPDFATHSALPVIPEAITDELKSQVKAASPTVPQDQGDARGTVGDAGDAIFEPPPRRFTRQQAVDFCAPHLAALRQAPVGTINTRLNDAAKALSHFLGPFWAADEARQWLHNALRATAYDGATWRADDTIGSAFRSAETGWRAEMAPDPFGQEEGAGQPRPEPSLVDAMEAELLTPDQVAERPPPVPLIMDWLDMDSLAWLIGKPGSYKSFLVLDWVAHVGGGQPWRGNPVRQGDAVYIVAEGVTGMSKRVRAWQNRYGPMKGVTFLPRPVQAGGPEWAVLVELARRRAPVLIVLDTQARVTVGMDENDNTEMGRFIHRAEELRAATGACVLVVHHIGRNGEDARGASALDGAQSTEIKIKRSDTAPLTAVIGQDKQKDMAELEDVEVSLQVVDLGLDQQTGREISSLVLAPMSPFDTARERKRVRDWLDRLAENQADLFGVMVDIYTPGSATKSELRAAVKERRGEQGRPEMPKQSFDKAFNALIHKELFVQIKGVQRYMIDPDRISDIATQSDEDIDDHRGDDFSRTGSVSEDQEGSDLRPPWSPT